MAKQKNPCLTFGRAALTKLDSLQNRTAGELPYDLSTQLPLLILSFTIQTHTADRAAA